MTLSLTVDEMTAAFDKCCPFQVVCRIPGFGRSPTDPDIFATKRYFVAVSSLGFNGGQHPVRGTLLIYNEDEDELLKVSHTMAREIVVARAIKDGLTKNQGKISVPAFLDCWHPRGSMQSLGVVTRLDDLWLTLQRMNPRPDKLLIRTPWATNEELRTLLPPRLKLKDKPTKSLYYSHDRNKVQEHLGKAPWDGEETTATTPVVTATTTAAAATSSSSRHVAAAAAASSSTSTLPLPVAATAAASSPLSRPVATATSSPVSHPVAPVAGPTPFLTVYPSDWPLRPIAVTPSSTTHVVASTASSSSAAAPSASTSASSATAAAAAATTQSFGVRRERGHTDDVGRKRKSPSSETCVDEDELPVWGNVWGNKKPRAQYEEIKGAMVDQYWLEQKKQMATALQVVKVVTERIELVTKTQEVLRSNGLKFTFVENPALLTAEQKARSMTFLP
jgi:hypothetical protein